MSEDKMSPEIAPNIKKSHRVWSKIEIAEIRRDINQVFDDMVIRFSGKPVSHSKSNGEFDRRTSEFQDKAVVELEKDVTQLDHPTDSGLGLSEPEVKLPKPQLKTNPSKV